MVIRGCITRLALASVTLSIVAVGAAHGDVTLGDVTVSADSNWEEGIYTMESLTVTAGATLSVAGGSTINVAGTIAVTDGATILLQGKHVAAPVEGEWRGAGVTITAGDVRVDADCTISADAQGYLGGAGPGPGGTDVEGHGGAGGGHGGVGGRAGDNVNLGGEPYGDAFAPVDLGSGGGPTRTAAGSGGGAITLRVSGTLALDGKITASGAAAVNGNCFSAPAGGGGAGGAIHITAATLTGAGSIVADGGRGADGGCFPGVGDDGGGGAGGRIAVLYGTDGGFEGFTASSVSGGAGGGHVGAPGTLVFVDTTSDALRVTQHLDIAADAAVRFGGVTVEDAATLVLGGGSTMAVDDTLRVIGDSLVLVKGRDTGGQVEGAWQGAGATINARAVHVEAGSAISADGQGYLADNGPGAGGADGVHGGAGGGHGGIGARAGDDVNPGGAAYGDAFAPVDLGSGGGATRTAAGSGGGAITLNVTDALRLDGTISADGSDAERGNCFSAPAGGGGAGGTIFITTATLAGTGILSADGGAGADGGCFPSVRDDGGGGAGGRIAVRYAIDGGFTGFTTASVSGGSGGGGAAPPGTMLFLDTATQTLRVSQHLELPPDTTASFGALLLDDEATLTLGGGTRVTLERDLIVTGGSTVLARGDHTDGQIGGRWQGSGVTISARDARVDAGSAISADGQGYQGGLGPGGGGSDGSHGGGGGGFGGAGGDSGDGFNAGGSTYGEASAPLDLGSGGGAANSRAGDGGGAVRIDVADRLLLDGVISANGGDASGVGCSLAGSGGGAAGSILVVATTLAGAGSLHADGGAGGAGGCTGLGDDGGGGGGGRIAVHYQIDDAFAGVTTSSVAGGAGGRSGAAGTILFISCGGDCDGDGRVTIDELVRMVNVALGTSEVLTCLAGDENHNAAITVEELIGAVNDALGGCPG